MTQIETGCLGVNNTREFHAKLFGAAISIRLELARLNKKNLQGAFIELDDIDRHTLPHKRIVLGSKPEAERSENYFKPVVVPYGELENFKLEPREDGVKILSADFKPYPFVRSPDSPIGVIIDSYLKGESFYIGYAAYTISCFRDHSRQRIEGIHSFFLESLES